MVAPGFLWITRQRPEYLWVSHISIPPKHVPFTRIHSCIYCSDPRTQSDPILESEPKPGDALFISFYFFVLLNFFFQKCCDPNPWLDPNGGSKPEPDLLLHFHLSYQNILFYHFVAEAVSVLSKPIIIYKFNAIR